MNKEKYNNFKEMYLKHLEGFKTKKEKIEYLEDVEFSINMIDMWDDNDKIAMKVISDLINEIKGE